MFTSINEWQRQCAEMTGRGLSYVWEDNVTIHNKEILGGCELDISGLGY